MSKITTCENAVNSLPAQHCSTLSARFGQLNLLLPSVPRDESLKLLDDYAAAVAQYRG